MLKWFVCLVRRHQWYTWYDKDLHRNRTACYRCEAERSKMIDSDITSATSSRHCSYSAQDH